MEKRRRNVQLFLLPNANKLNKKEGEEGGKMQKSKREKKIAKAGAKNNKNYFSCYDKSINMFKPRYADICVYLYDQKKKENNAL